MIMLQGWKMTKCLGYSMFHVRTFRGARSNAESVRLLLRVRGLRRMSAVNVHCSHSFLPAREGLAPPDSANTANLVVFAESGGAKDSVAPLFRGMPRHASCRCCCPTPQLLTGHCAFKGLQLIWQAHNPITIIQIR